MIDTIRELIRTKKAFDNGPVGDSPFVLLLQNLQLDTNDFQVALNAIIPVCNPMVVLDRTLNKYIYHAFSPTRNRR